MTDNLDPKMENLLRTLAPEVEPGAHMVRTRNMILVVHHKEESSMLSMRRLVIACAALAVVCVLAYSSLRTPYSKALAATVEALGEVTSMVCVTTTWAAGGEEVHNTVRWVAPDTYRIDYEGLLNETRWINGSEVTILNHTTQRAQSIRNLTGFEVETTEGVLRIASPEGMLTALRSGEIGDLVEESASANTEHTIYRFSGAEMGEVTFLVNNVTNLPVSLTSSLPGEWTSQKLRMEFRWNERFDPEIMEPAIPEGIPWEVLDYAVAAAPLPVYPGVGIGPIKIGMTLDKVVAIWGEADNSLAGVAHQYYAHGVEVVLDKKSRVRQVGALFPSEEQRKIFPIKRFTGSTVDGLGDGSSEAEIVAALGKPEKRQEDTGILVLTYGSLGIEFKLHQGHGSDGDYGVSVIAVRAPEEMPR